MGSLSRFTEKVVAFRDRRDWAQFHHPKELASALAIEVAEAMELFRFLSPEEIAEKLSGEPEYRERLGHELADSLFLLLLLAHDSGVDLQTAFEGKLALLEDRYPEESSRGRNLKWTEYRK